MTRQLYHPRQRMQNDGHPLGWKNCTCTAAAVCEDVSTFGANDLSGGQVRDATGDKLDGTTPDQVDAALLKLTGEDHLSTGYFSPKEIRAGIREGKTFLACVRYDVVRDWCAKQRAQGVRQEDLVAGSEAFGGWHAVVLHMRLAAGESVSIVCEVQEGNRRTVINKTVFGPGTVVYEPLADGRRRTVAKGIVVYPDELLEEVFAASKLWRGKLYGSWTPPGWLPEPPPPGKPPKPIPEVHLRKGAKLATTAFRGPWKVTKPSYLRTSPRKNRRDPMGNVARSVPVGFVFRSRQTAQGTLIQGSRRWLGNVTGDLWIHESRARRVKCLTLPFSVNRDRSSGPQEERQPAAVITGVEYRETTEVPA